MQCFLSHATLRSRYLITVIFLWSSRGIDTRVRPWERGRSTSCHWWVVSLAKATKYNFIIEHLTFRLHLSTGFRFLAYHPHLTASRSVTCWIVISTWCLRHCVRTFKNVPQTFAKMSATRMLPASFAEDVSYNSFMPHVKERGVGY